MRLRSALSYTRGIRSGVVNNVGALPRQASSRGGTSNDTTSRVVRVGLGGSSANLTAPVQM